MELHNTKWGIMYLTLCCPFLLIATRCRAASMLCVMSYGVLAVILPAVAAAAAIAKHCH